MEGIALRVENGPPGVGIRYKVHMAGHGDSSFCYDGQYCGTKGESRRIEAIYVELTGINEYMFTTKGVY